MRRTTAILLASLVALSLLAASCSKPWSHPDYSGTTAKEMFEADSLDCKVIAGDEFPLDGHKRMARFKGCMNDRGWQHDEDHQGLRFETKPI